MRIMLPSIKSIDKLVSAEEDNVPLSTLKSEEEGEDAKKDTCIGLKKDWIKKEIRDERQTEELEVKHKANQDRDAKLTCSKAEDSKDNNLGLSEEKEFLLEMIEEEKGSEGNRVIDGEEEEENSLTSKMDISVRMQ